MLMFDDSPQAEKETRVEAEPTAVAETAEDAAPADAPPSGAEPAPTGVAEPTAQRRPLPASETEKPTDTPSAEPARPTPVPKTPPIASARPEQELPPEVQDPRKRRPAQYAPPSGPSPSRFRPRQALTDVNLADINYKNVEVLSQFLDNQGRILSRRKTRVSAKMQRRVRSAIKQARYLALLPYTPSHIRSVRRR